jgi:glycosyltransferase involved in cell wall biosynthesis
MFIRVPEMQGFDGGVPTGVVGYGTMLYGFKTALEKLGHTVAVGKGDGGPFVHFCAYLHIKQLVKDHPTTGKRLMFTMWEAEEISPSYITDLNKHTDGLIVPNNWNKEVFQKNGYKKKVEVVPLGINPSFFNRKKRSYKKGDEFRFLHYNAGEPRKGWFSLVHAFFEEFKNEPNVKLVVKNSRVHERQMNKTMSSLPQELYNRMEFHRGALPIEVMIDLLHNAHCFLFPALGEGYGLPPREAMATGLPTIVTDGHSFSELPDYYQKVETYFDKGGFAFRTKYAPISGLGYVGDFYRGKNLAYPKIDSLRAKMREVYENYDDYASQAYKNAPEVHQMENIELHAEKFIKAVEGLTL